MNRLYPVGIQNFEDLRSRGYIYVDKTLLLYNLVQTGKYYFLSRPRRFGKSLMISTLEAYFLGKRELFKGLAMESLEKDWTVHPVLHMDLNTEKYDTEASLENKLELTLKQWEAEYGHNPDEYSVATRFEGVIRRAAKKMGQKVVILIDEYDKPMLQAITNPELQTKFRNTLTEQGHGFIAGLQRHPNHFRAFGDKDAPLRVNAVAQLGFGQGAEHFHSGMLQRGDFDNGHNVDFFE
jgi:hypothetical protein